MWEVLVIHYTDGEWTWTNAVTYHVEKYHLRLPDDFVKKVINNEEWWSGIALGI